MARAVLTSSAAGTYGAVGWVRGVATNVSYSGIEQGVLGEVVAVEMFDTPEASGGDDRLLRALWVFGRRLLASGALGTEAHG